MNLFGSSRFSANGLTDSQEEVFVSAEAVRHPFDDFDLVVRSLKHTGVRGMPAMGQNAVKTILES